MKGTVPLRDLAEMLRVPLRTLQDHVATLGLTRKARSANADPGQMQPTAIPDGHGEDTLVAPTIMGIAALCGGQPPEENE